METNSYQSLKEFISTKLQKLEFPLAQNSILGEINRTQQLILSLGNETFGQILSLDEFTPITEEDWNRLQRELETHFEVKYEKGYLIQGQEQQERDTTWWTSVNKQKSTNFYWERYKKHLSTELPPEVVKTIDDDTDIVMNNIENPTLSSFSRYGMVVGHVQSGKTGNYSSLICKAADAGYKFIVVIAGGINNLRDQTQERLNESFVGQTNGVQVGAGKGNTSKETTPLSLTTIDRDFNKQDADRLSQGLNFDNIKVPILIVIKKNSRTLDNVIEWLQNQYKNKVVDHAMLIIDDESDYASINTKEENDPTSINKRLRILLSLFHKSDYVAYTATPYANIFIDHNAENDDLGRDLFPKDFIYALDAPSNYLGARKIFIESPKKYLVPTHDYVHTIPSDHKIDFYVEQLPDSLLEAMRMFVINIGIRNLRGHGNKHNSMLVHASRFTDIHIRLSVLVGDYLTKIKQDVIAFGKLKDAATHSPLINDLENTFKKYYTVEYTWIKVLTVLTELINSIVVREVHQRTSVPLEYRKDVVTNAIVIGGSSLSRGFTLEGLSISYFLRNTIFYDTLMQMGRWFGYRPGYEDLCKVFMPADRITDFANIIEATEELFEDFKLMSKSKMTPYDFGLAVQEKPDSALQITARNKQKNVREFFFSMQLDGTAKETSYLIDDGTAIEKNIKAIKNLIDTLGPSGNPDNEGSHVWRGVPRQTISTFLKSFTTFSNDRLGLSSRMPLAFIEKYADENTTDWDVALYTGSGSQFTHNSISIKKELRQLVKKNGYYEVSNRQVSSGNSEAIAIEDTNLRKQLGNNRRSTRENLKRPLLMLHILEQNVNDTNETKEVEEIAAFGVSFPGSVVRRENTVRLKINTVYYQNLLKQIETESESDD